jgi:predicted deacylase
MATLEMYENPFFSSQTNSIEVRETKWIRASISGIFHLQVKLGQTVEKRELLGFITDTFGDTNIKVRSPQAGIVIGHTQNPLVNQGDGIINLAIKPL